MGFYIACDIIVLAGLDTSKATQFSVSLDQFYTRIAKSTSILQSVISKYDPCFFSTTLFCGSSEQRQQKNPLHKSLWNAAQTCSVALFTLTIKKNYSIICVAITPMKSVQNNCFFIEEAGSLEL